MEPQKALTIGGSDSGGAAGIQADLKTWTALGIYGMSAITAVTAQNSVTVNRVQYLEPELVAAQIDTVLADYGADAVKTGFIGQTKLIQAIANQLTAHKPANIVIDPVLVNHLGQPMFSGDVIDAYRRHLIPLANLITPNWREAMILAHYPQLERINREDIQDIVNQLHQVGAQNILVTGHDNQEEMIDWFSDGQKLQPLATPKIHTANRHGSGDTLSAAICAYLAKEFFLEKAILHAQAFTAKAMQNAASWTLGRGHGPLSHFI